MPHFERVFTVDEARALLPELRRAFARIHALMDEIQKKRLGQGGEVQFFSANGHGPRVAGGDDGELLADIQKAVGDIHAKGIQVKDLRRGLCDFPCQLFPDGDVVFLCWELSESDIGYWHRVDDNYAGRVRLENE